MHSKRLSLVFVGTCECEDGYSTRMAPVDVCSTLDSCGELGPCQNGGSCVNGNCHCHPGFVGVNCESKFLELSEN